MGVLLQTKTFATEKANLTTTVKINKTNNHIIVKNSWRSV